jgi:hypothetical protein|tara:strand:- start:234 stop:545 length:312 start_codon:yes stop_codon:yes gene_type:complete
MALRSNSSEKNLRQKDPEEKLWLAVLSQAVFDAFKEKCKKSSYKYSRINSDKYLEEVTKEARDWLFSGSKDFHEICELAGKNPIYVKEKIKKRVLKDKGWYIV